MPCEHPWIVFLERVDSSIRTRQLDPAQCVVLLPLQLQVPWVRHWWQSHKDTACPQLYALDDTRDTHQASLPSLGLGTLLWQARARLADLPRNAQAALGPVQRLAKHVLSLLQQAWPWLGHYRGAERSAVLARVREVIYAPLEASSSSESEPIWNVLEQGLELLVLDWLETLTGNPDDVAFWQCWPQAPLVFLLDDGLSHSPCTQMMQALARQHLKRTLIWSWDDLQADAQSPTLAAATKPHLCIEALDPQQELLYGLQWLQQQRAADSTALCVIVCEDAQFCTLMEQQCLARGIACTRSPGHAAPIASHALPRQLLSLMQAAAEDADPDTILAAVDLLDSDLALDMETAWQRLQRQLGSLSTLSAWQQTAQLPWPDSARQQRWQRLAEQIRAWHKPRDLATWQDDLQRGLSHLYAQLSAVDPVAVTPEHLAAWQATLRLMATDPTATHVAAPAAMIRHSPIMHWLQQCLSLPTPQALQRLQRSDDQAVLLLTLDEAAALQGLLPCATSRVLCAACDAQHLPLLPAQITPGLALGQTGPRWSLAAQTALGFAPESARIAARQAAWSKLLQYPHLTITWSQHTQDRALGPSPLVLLRQLQQADAFTTQAAADHIALHTLTCRAPLPPQPHAAQWPLGPLSATSVEWLRACPYRFFAQHLLQLQVQEPLQRAQDARDVGTLLHHLLWLYQKERQRLAAANASASAPTPPDNAALDWAWQTLQSETQLDSLPSVTLRWLWPQFKQALLDWQNHHEHQGWRFKTGEQSLAVQLNAEGSRGPGLSLKGRLDRLDTRPNAAAAATPDDTPSTVHIIDYKNKRSSNLKIEPAEEVQLVFYAALLRLEHAALTPEQPVPAIDASYLSLKPDKAPHDKNYLPQLALQQTTLAHAHVWAERLLLGLQNDLADVHQGQTLPAFAAPATCQHCPTSGLCRMHAWSG